MGVTDKTVADVGCVMAGTLINEHIKPAITGNANANVQMLAKTVHKTMYEASKRKQNITVSGIPEHDDIEDTRTFLDLCTEHLDTKPILAHRWRRRLNSKMNSRLRRLLVNVYLQVAAEGLITSSKTASKNDKDFAEMYILIDKNLSR